MNTTSKTVYFDNNATTRVAPEVRDAMEPFFCDLYGNPSSMHFFGGQVARHVERAREEVAAFLNCEPDEVYFTSCATESDNTAIRGSADWYGPSMKVVTTAVEHPAVLQPARRLRALGHEEVELPVDAVGQIDLGALRAALAGTKNALVSVMWANNETGVVFPIREVAEIAKEFGATMHTDAVQGFMKLPFSAKKLGADMISISGHKIHAPKGIGALYIKTGVKIKPLIHGGAQESGLRAGTEAMPQIAAFGKAAEIAFAGMKENCEKIAKLRESAASAICAEMPEAVIIGGGAPHILSVSLPGWRSEVLMNFLEAEGIYVSRSSACKKGGRSHVLEAMHLPAQVIDGAIRISFSRYNTEDDVLALCASLKCAHDTLAHR